MSQYLGEHCRFGERGDGIILMPAARPGAQPGFVDVGDHTKAVLLHNNTSLAISGLDETDANRLGAIDVSRAVWRNNQLYFGSGKGSYPLMLGNLVPGFEATIQVVPVR